MRIALCTTTIHVPHALKLLRKCSSDRFTGAKFFVIGDEKSPDAQIAAICEETDAGASWNVSAQKYQHEDVYMREHFGLSEYYDVERQKALEYKCSKLLGWSNLSRRNIAFLEALKWGAEAIVAWDTDNYPVNDQYFNDFAKCFQSWPYAGGDPRFNGIVASGKDGWFDAGAYLRPPAKHRGFPIQRKHQPVYSTITDAKIGVAAGLILNDPDVDATTRIVQAPESQEVSLLMDAGVVVDLHTWTTVNTQNTAVIRDLVPAWFLGPGLERMDDIYAGMIVQRVGRERGYHVHVGQPFALQQRHPHDIIKDLRAEIEGYERVVQLAELLDSIMLVGKNTIDDTRKIYATLEHCEWYPKQAVKAAHAYLDDCESLA